MAEGLNERSGGSSRPEERSDGTRDAVRRERDREIAASFREMTQAERLQDKRTNPAAKQLAAMDAAIDARYGRGTSAAARMRAAAREAVAKTLERGKPIRAPRVHELQRHAEHRRDDARLQRDAAANQSSRDLER